MVLPLIAAFTVTMVWLVSLGVTQARTVDAAREVARSAARGDTIAQARSWGARVAPEGSRFVIAKGEQSIVVNVMAPVEDCSTSCRASRCVRAPWRRQSNREFHDEVPR